MSDCKLKLPVSFKLFSNTANLFCFKTSCLHGIPRFAGTFILFGEDKDLTEKRNVKILQTYIIVSLVALSRNFLMISSSHSQSTNTLPISFREKLDDTNCTLLCNFQVLRFIVLDEESSFKVSGNTLRCCQLSITKLLEILHYISETLCSKQCNMWYSKQNLQIYQIKIKICY